MPAEKFYPATAVENDGSEPTLTVGWGGDTPAVTLNGVESDRSGINRLIDVLVRARNATFGADADGKGRTVTVTLKADTSEFEATMREAEDRVRRLKL